LSNLCQKLDFLKFFWYNDDRTGGNAMIKLDYSIESPEERNKLV
jgi:hypothetical protein